MKIKYALIVLVMLFSTTSFAKDKSKKPQRIDFDGLDVDGEVRTPDGQYLLQKSRVDFLPIYEVKDEMQNEIRKSVFFLR